MTTSPEAGPEANPTSSRAATGSTEFGFDVALPGTWWAIPVADPAETERAVGDIVSATIGRRDQDARLRAELRARFLYAADRARSSGAVQLHLCREVMPDVPLPATLTVYWPRIALRASDDPVEALRGVLGTITEASDAGAENLGDDDRAFPCGAAVRRRRIVTAEPGSPEEGVRTVEIDYWIATPSHRVLLLSFACGLPDLAEQLASLFDLVVTTLTWTPRA
ncbi:MAG: hypothetical protein EPO52_15075 [Herbiconiux sp.]|uniref:hypothetical protein n=1 Tax=Herbiconiux sp. TaxID=1871186 RepID=UPI0012070C22|nr:hypothetical protein [Herbiconiux sp.]TAJ46854.1 MAG: hypothetical protein EPO52_15075 [Herbiconiux sp.]